MNNKIKKITEWESATTSKTHLGLRDFKKDVYTTEELTPEELNELQEQFHADPECPGWTGVIAKKINEQHYRFVTTWDFSD